MALPVIITAFAFEEDQQSREAHLDYLIEEKEAIIKILDKKNEQVKHIDIINPTPDKIIQAIEDNKSNLSIFHFSGHANQEYLQTHNFKTIGKGLAGMMEECYALKLVVLNGCNTGGQVASFIEQGIPCIIGTNSAVGDMTAKNFAVSFYENFFGNCDDLATSFNKAIKIVNVTKAINPIIVNRSLGAEDGDKDGEWVLSSTAEMLKLVSENLDETRAYQPNKRISEIMLKLRPEVEAENDTIDFSGLTDEQLFNNETIRFLSLFPLPIANQLQKLLSRPTNDEVNSSFTDRVKRLLHTYQTITELSSAILLAQLWDGLEKPENRLIVTDDLKQITADLLNNLFDSTNKLPIFYQILQWFSTKNPVLRFAACKPINDFFLKKITDKRVQLQEAAIFFKDIASKLENYGEREARLSCGTAENHLAEWLDFSRVLCRYRLLSIRNVNLLQYRDVRKMQYDCKIFSFVGASKNQSQYKIDTLDYATENSVILIDKDAYKTKNLTNYLNLSPFLIDSIMIDERKTISDVYYPVSFEEINKKIQYRNISNLADDKIYHISGNIVDDDETVATPTGINQIPNVKVYNTLANQIFYFKKLFIWNP